jgi:alkylation response protein AidB-like acyl-CoA dehydrogenase
MDFELTEEQQDIRSAIKEFCQKELTKEYVRWLDENCDFPPEDIWKKLANIGVHGLIVPEEYGGAGLGYIETVIVLEELSKACSSIGVALAVNLSFGQRTLTELGNENQKKEYLPHVRSGDLKWAMALTEPAGGTDILGTISSTAVEDGGDYIINGQKTFISAAHVANYINTVVITDEKASKKSKALSTFIVDARNPGITITKIPKLGNHACAACEVFFDDVRVPKENLLGTLNNGWYELLSTLNPERISVAANAVGISMAVLEDAVAYAKRRYAFGKPIGEFMAVQHMIADMAIEIELARTLTYKCAWLVENGKPYAIESVIAKQFASDRAVIHAINGMEILGGYGYCMEYDMQRYLRDAKQFPFAPLNNESCKNMIAEAYGLPRSF